MPFAWWRMLSCLFLHDSVLQILVECKQLTYKSHELLARVFYVWSVCERYELYFGYSNICFVRQ